MAHRIGIDARKLTDDSAISAYIRRLTGALAELDHENEYFLFVSAHGDPALDGLPGNFHAVVEACPVYSVREQMSLSWRLLRLKLDLYHATHYLLPAIVPCRAVISVYDIVDVLYPHFVPSRLAFYYAQRQIRRSLARGDRIIADSRNTKTDLMDYLGLDGRRIRVIYPGVPDEYGARLDRAAADSILDRLGITAPYLLFVEPTSGPSNLDLVVAAFAEAVAARPFEGSLICSGPRAVLDYKVRQRAERHGIADRLILLGPLAEGDRPAVYQGAELFLYPTLGEGTALTVVEAMAAGTPVVASSTAALREIAEGHALLVDPLDRAAVAATIADCMGNPERRRQLTEQAAKRAADFKWRRAAATTLEVYQSALRQRAWRPRNRRRGATE